MGGLFAAPKPRSQYVPPAAVQRPPATNAVSAGINPNEEEDLARKEREAQIERAASGRSSLIKTGGRGLVNGGSSSPKTGFLTPYGLSAGIKTKLGA